MTLSVLFFLFAAPLTPAPSVQVALAAAPARTSQKGSSNMSQILVGRELATQNCQTCHAIGRTGASPNPAAPRFRYLSRKYPIDSLSESFAEGVFIGHSVMPQFEFTPDKVEGLLAYLKSIQARPKPRRRK